MGFLDVLRGKRELKQPAPDRLFAMSTAYVKMEIELVTHAGERARFARGDVLVLSGLPLRALHNRGPEPAVLVSLARA